MTDIEINLNRAYESVIDKINNAIGVSFGL